MVELFVIPIVALALVALLVKVLTGWATLRYSQYIERNHRAAECIVNEECLPEGWLRPFRERIARSSSGEAGELDCRRIQRAAQAHCLRELDSLARFFQRSSFVEGEETRSVLLAGIQECRHRCTSHNWAHWARLDVPTPDRPE